MWEAARAGSETVGAAWGSGHKLSWREGSRVCPAPWEGEAGGAEQFNSVISEEGRDCRKLKDICFLEVKKQRHHTDNKGPYTQNNVMLVAQSCPTLCDHNVMLVAQSCPTLCDPMESGSSVPGILQARILEWVAISFSRGSS